MKVYYLNHYVDDKHMSDRISTPSANTKIEYILSVMSEYMPIINLSTAICNKGYFSKKRVINQNNIQYLYVPSFNLTKGIFGRINILFSQIYIFYFLLKKINKNDIIIVYHSLYYINVLTILKKIKKFNLIIEINDFYQFHFTDDQKIKKIKSIEDSYFKIADKYILANPDMMNELVNKDYLVNYGAYITHEKIDKRMDNKIKILYSGVVENLRKAAILSLDSINYLPNNYELHFACYGNKQEMADLQNRIIKTNLKLEREAVLFHGTLNSVNLKKLMIDCDISLNCHTYSKNKEYQAKYSFPSKIPLNMGCGLYIVTSNLSTFRNTPFSQCMEYFNNFDPKSLANAILKLTEEIKNNSFSEKPEYIVKKLDAEFRQEMKKMLEDF